MDISERLDNIMELIYDISREPSIYSQKSGVSAATIIMSYNERYNINFENSGYDDIRLLMREGWIEEAPPIIPNVRPILAGITRIKLTIAGIQHVEKIRQPFIKKTWKELFMLTIGGITSAIIKAFKKD